ncbi:MAG TPA: hypothetical protein DF637_08825 [Rikenellaceae bacterium]|nr:hypothetical protein [Rikenellaceae bacterium]
MQSQIRIFISVFLLLCFGCSPITEQTDSKVIDIAAKVRTGEIVNLSHIADEIRYVPLETKKESLIDGGIIYVFFEKGHIYVVDNTNVKIFDSNGKYLSTINRLGRGPEEYSDILNANVDPQSGNVTIFSYSGKLKEYDINGNFISSVQIPDLKGCDFLNCIKFDDNTYLSSVQQRTDKGIEYSLVAFDALSKVKLIIDNPADNSELNVARIPSLLRFEDKIRIIHRDVDMDTVYSLTTDMKLEESFIFNYGKYKMPYNKSNYKEILGSKTSNNISLSGDVIESGNYLFLKFNFRGIKTESYERRWNIVCGIFNKVDGKLTLMKEPVKGKLGFRNDIDTGLVFWPYSQCSDNYLLSMYPADKFKTLADSSVSSAKVKEIAAKLDENDNPVVVIVKVK